MGFHCQSLPYLWYKKRMEGEKLIMEEEKKYIAGWLMWLLFLLIVTGVIFYSLNSLGLIGRTIIERKVFENSYQKKAADEDALSTYDAQLSILERRLRSSLTDSERAELQAQIDSINILKASKGN